MTDVKIPALPLGVALTGNELFECVQAGVSVHVPSSFFPANTESYLTLTAAPLLSASRRLVNGTGITFTDGGPGGTLTISFATETISLGDLSDVTLTAPVAGQVLGYDGAAWVNTSSPGVVFATPTGVIGLAAVAGVATTSVRSDSSPALSQAIIPTWTGVHTFDVAPRASSVAVDLGLTGARWGTIYGSGLVLTNPVNVANGGTEITSYAIGDLIYASGATTLSKLADVAVGSYLRSGGVGVAPLWSTTVLPNSATTGDLLYASAANTYSNLSDVAVGSYLTSGGVGVAPAWAAVSGLGANPTGAIGLVAVNGVASTFIRSDGAPALSQAIAPTWTGVHAWTRSTTGQTLTGTNSNAAANTWSEWVSTNSSGHGLHLTHTSAASNASFIPGAPASEAGLIYTDAAVPMVLGTSNTSRVQIGAAGNVTVNAPSSGTALSVNGLITSTAINNAILMSGATTNNQYLRSTTTGADSIFGSDSSAGASIFSGSPAYATMLGTTGATSVVIGTNSVTRIEVTSAGAVVLSRVGTGTTALNGAALNINSNQPDIQMYDANAAANEKAWILQCVGGTLSIQTSNDAFGSGTTAFSIARSGSSVTTTTVNGTNLTVTSASGNTIIVSGAGTNNQYMSVGNTGGTLVMGQESSAGGTVVTSAPAYAGFISTIASTQLALGTSSTARILISSSGAIRFLTYGAGTITSDASGNLTSVSDERLKSDIRPYRAGIAELMKLDPIMYGYTPDSNLDQSRSDYAGFSAQNVREVLPEAVDINPSGYLSLSDRPIIAALVNAIKDLQQQMRILQ